MEDVFFVAQQALVGQGFLIIKASPTLGDTIHGRTPLDE